MTFKKFYFDITFTKYLKIAKRNLGQASLEYFIIFSLIALLTIISLSTFFPLVQSALQGSSGRNGFFQEAVGVNGINIANQ